MTAAHMMDGGMMHFPWGVFWLFVQAAFWVLVIALVVAIVRRRPGTPSAPSSALRVLEERYARGEIGRDEFLERRAVLTENRGSS